MTPNWKELIFDVESNGLLPEHVEPPFCMDKLHCLVIKDIPTSAVRHFVRDDLLPLSMEDVGALNALQIDIPEPMSVGLKLLEEADLLVGHNIVDFDLDAIVLHEPKFVTDAAIVDTLVMVRMVFADVKEKDFRLAARGQLDGKNIGTHGLEAWGQRLGLHKGDYKKDREEELKQKHKDAGLDAPTKEELHDYVWGHWNVPMHAYMLQDAEVNASLWIKIESFDWSAEATQMEHEIHALMVQQERNGFYFNKELAESLGEQLQTEYDKLAEDATDQIGRWYKPTRWHDEELLNADHGEDTTRRAWGNVDFPKRTMNFAKSNEKLDGDYTKMRPNTIEGVPFCRVELKDFNPNSRPQIVDRLSHLYGWTPQDFTEKGSPRVDDTILRELAEHVPLAATLAEIFYYKKRIGMVVDGKNGWLKLVRADSRIHGRVNVGGTVSGRATHAAPNVSQVPGVNPVEIKAEPYKGFDAEAARKKFDDTVARHTNAGTYISSKWKDAKDEGAIYVKGREGDHGWDCRELFTVPPGYKLVGCDLSGIEFRCLGNLTFPFDDGEIIDQVLNGDIHQRNADLGGISRSVAKRALYAAMYGGGDAKLGSIMEPLASEGRQKTLGKDLRGKLMSAMPSLNQAIKEIHREARKNGGTIAGLDGRRLYIRAKHAALNLRLQSDGALIAKKWCLLTDDMFYDEGWEHNINGDYAFCSWSHDEIQVAVRDELAERAAEIMEAAAPLAGEHFKFKCPVAAEAKIGNTWADTH
jgi:hypothetical protein